MKLKGATLFQRWSGAPKPNFMCDSAHTIILLLLTLTLSKDLAVR
jgi:hypothetical protein